MGSAFLGFLQPGIFNLREGRFELQPSAVMADFELAFIQAYYIDYH